MNRARDVGVGHVDDEVGRSFDPTDLATVLAEHVLAIGLLVAVIDAISDHLATTTFGLSYSVTWRVERVPVVTGH
jgi:hypothetical protein